MHAYVAMHDVMCILSICSVFAVAYTESVPPFGMLQQYGNKGGMAATLRILRRLTQATTNEVMEDKHAAVLLSTIGGGTNVLLRNLLALR